MKLQIIPVQINHVRPVVLILVFPTQAVMPGRMLDSL